MVRKESSKMTIATLNLEGDAVPPIENVRPQIAALCWRKKRGQVEVLLITSRDTGRWVIPKGWPMDGRTAFEAAAIEAWEEAGVRGAIADQALGCFDYDKLHPSKPTQRCQVSVYPLRVAQLERKFPEREERRRKWFSARKAAKSVHEAELAELILRASVDLAK